MHLSQTHLQVSVYWETVLAFGTVWTCFALYSFPSQSSSSDLHAIISCRTLEAAQPCLSLCRYGERACIAQSRQRGAVCSTSQQITPDCYQLSGMNDTSAQQDCMNHSYTSQYCRSRETCTLNNAFWERPHCLNSQAGNKTKPELDFNALIMKNALYIILTAIWLYISQKQDVW